MSLEAEFRATAEEGMKIVRNLASEQIINKVSALEAAHLSLATIRTAAFIEIAAQLIALREGKSSCIS